MNEINEKHYQVKQELMKLAASNSVLSSLALFVNLLVITIAFWDITNKIFLITWMISIVILLTIRTLIAKYFLNNPLKIALEKVETYFKVLTLTGGVFLSIGLVIILPEELPFHQAFLSMIVAGVSAGSVMGLSYSRTLALNYLLILLLPFIYIIYIQGTQLHMLISILMFLFMLMLILFSRRYYRNLLDIILSKILINQAQRELKLSENNFTSIFKEVPIGIFTYDKDLIITEANQAFASLLKAPLELLINLDMKELPDRSIQSALTMTLKGEKGFYEGLYHTKISNKDIQISMRTVPMFDIDQTIKGGLGIVENITERIASEKKIRHQAFYDHLTGLANRLTLNKHLKQQLLRSKKDHRFAAILFIDIDHFKTINDSLGHDIGDTLLKIFAQRASRLVREEDTTARLGGDEFVILLSDLSEDELLAIKRANTVAEKLHELMKEPINLKSHSLHITLSIGITIIGSKQNNINDILKHADLAMYKAKQLGRNTTCFFEEEMSKNIKEQLILQNELRIAIEKEQFELYYQPIVHINSDKITSCEALIRWNHPTRGLIYPDSFIPHAEKNGLIIPLGKWVMQRACRDYQELKEYIVNIAINISSKQFNQQEFIKDILEITQKHNINPNNIKLELTESVALDNQSETIDKMKILKSHGFIIAMDDFGTGYSSLSYLKNLPFDFIKIDRHFIKNILNNESDASLVKTIVAISKQFKFFVVAEGVETQEQAALLKSLECDYIQGYVISKPVPIDEFKKLF